MRCYSSQKPLERHCNRSTRPSTMSSMRQGSARKHHLVPWMTVHQRNRCHPQAHFVATLRNQCTSVCLEASLTGLPEFRWDPQVHSMLYQHVRLHQQTCLQLPLRQKTIHLPFVAREKKIVTDMERLHNLFFTRIDTPKFDRFVAVVLLTEVLAVALRNQP